MTVDQIVAEVFTLPNNSVTDELELRRIPSWDSMSHMLLIVRLEESFGMEFTNDQVLDVRTVGDIKKLINREPGV